MSSTASGADASDGLAGDLAEAQHQQAEPRAQDLSVLAARPYHRAAQPGVGDWALGHREAVNHGHPDAQGVFLLGGDHGLAQQESAELAAVQYDGRDLLCRGARGSLSSLRPTRDLQQRPGLPVYHSPACWRLPAFGSAWTANCMDNVFVERLWRSLKYEDIYLRAYATGSEARLGSWIAGYNTTRPHQALGYRTPDEVYQSPPVAGLAPTPIGVAA